MRFLLIVTLEKLIYYFVIRERSERKRDKRDRSRSRDKDRERKRDKERKERKPEFDIKIKEEPVDGELNKIVFLCQRCKRDS